MYPYLSNGSTIGTTAFSPYVNNVSPFLFSIIFFYVLLFFLCLCDFWLFFMLRGNEGLISRIRVLPSVYPVLDCTQLFLQPQRLHCRERCDSLALPGCDTNTSTKGIVTGVTCNVCSDVTRHVSARILFG